jgi:hypothetical protein
MMDFQLKLEINIKFNPDPINWIGLLIKAAGVML